ncbi:MAG: hypothetical protein MUC41_17460 [Syntrophobacteraceae bacterium]|nr:hypothetical protein [Syntrophobacteraceae bacterium]
MKPHHGMVLITALAVLTLPGCARRAGVETWTAPTPGAERLVILEERARQWEMYQGVLRINAEGPKGTLRRVRTMVLAAPPHMLRMEALNPFGQSVGLLLFARDEASLWIPSEKALYTSERAETLIQHLLGIPIPTEVFIYSLAGVVPPKVLVNMREQSVASGWRVQARDPSEPWTTTWEFGTSPFTLKEIRVAGESRDITVRYEPPVDLAARGIPERLIFSAPGWQLEVKVDQVQSVKELQGGAFQVRYPSGLRRIDLDREPWKATGL